MCVVDLCVYGVLYVGIFYNLWCFVGQVLLLGVGRFLFLFGCKAVPLSTVNPESRVTQCGFTNVVVVLKEDVIMNIEWLCCPIR